MIKNVIIVALLVITLFSVFYGISQGAEARDLREEVVLSRTNSEMAQRLADMQRTLAVANEARADSVVKAAINERDRYSQLIECITEEYRIREDQLNQLVNNCE